MAMPEADNPWDDTVHARSLLESYAFSSNSTVRSVRRKYVQDRSGFVEFLGDMRKCDDACSRQQALAALYRCGALRLPRTDDTLESSPSSLRTSTLVEDLRDVGRVQVRRPSPVVVTPSRPVEYKKDPRFAQPPMIGKASGDFARHMQRAAGTFKLQPDIVDLVFSFSEAADYLSMANGAVWDIITEHADTTSHHRDVTKKQLGEVAAHLDMMDVEFACFFQAGLSDSDAALAGEVLTTHQEAATATLMNVAWQESAPRSVEETLRALHYRDVRAGLDVLFPSMMLQWAHDDKLDAEEMAAVHAALREKPLRTSGTEMTRSMPTGAPMLGNGNDDMPPRQPRRSAIDPDRTEYDLDSARFDFHHQVMMALLRKASEGAEEDPADVRAEEDVAEQMSVWTRWATKIKAFADELWGEGRGGRRAAGKVLKYTAAVVAMAIVGGGIYMYWRTDPALVTNLTHVTGIVNTNIERAADLAADATTVGHQILPDAFNASVPETIEALLPHATETVRDLNYQKALDVIKDLAYEKFGNVTRPEFLRLNEQLKIARDLTSTEDQQIAALTTVEGILKHHGITVAAPEKPETLVKVVEIALAMNLTKIFTDSFWNIAETLKSYTPSVSTAWRLARMGVPQVSPALRWIYDRLMSLPAIDSHAPIVMHFMTPTGMTDESIFQNMLARVGVNIVPGVTWALQHVVRFFVQLYRHFTLWGWCGNLIHMGGGMALEFIQRLHGVLQSVVGLMGRLMGSTNVVGRILHYPFGAIRGVFYLSERLLRLVELTLQGGVYVDIAMHQLPAIQLLLHCLATGFTYCSVVMASYLPLPSPLPQISTALVATAAAFVIYKCRRLGSPIGRAGLWIYGWTPRLIRVPVAMIYGNTVLWPVLINFFIRGLGGTPFDEYLLDKVLEPR